MDLHHATSIPRWQESLPPCQVGLELGIELDPVVEVLGLCRQVNHPPQKDPAHLYYLASVGQLPSQRQQFALPAHPFVPPGTDQ